MSSKIKEKCIRKDCIVDPCPRKRPVTTPNGFCVPYDNGKQRNAIPKKKGKVS